MTRLSTLTLALTVLATAACGTKTSPSNGPTPSNTQFTFTAAISAANETTAVVGETGAAGSATITMTVTRDANSTITAGQANFVVNLSGFPQTTVFTMAHIHEGAANVAGPVKVNTALASSDITLVNGAGTFTKLTVAVPADVATNMINNPAGYYFNIHTAVNGGGVARGQLIKQ
jgi:CHRD domain